MQRRLHHALGQSSEIRACFVLIIVYCLLIYRKLQRKWRSLPGILYVIDYINTRQRIRLTRILYKAHWV